MGEQGRTTKDTKLALNDKKEVKNFDIIKWNMQKQDPHPECKKKKRRQI